MVVYQTDDPLVNRAPLPTDLGSQQTAPLDLPPSPSPSPAEGGSAAQTPGPGTILPGAPQNAPAASPGDIGTNPQQDPFAAKRAELDALDAQANDPFARKRAELDAADLVDGQTEEHGILRNWAGEFFGRTAEHLGNLGWLASKFTNGMGLGDLAGKAVLHALKTAPPEEVPAKVTNTFAGLLAEKDPGKQARILANLAGLPTEGDEGSMAGEIGKQTSDGLLFLAGIAALGPGLGAVAGAAGLTRTGAFITKIADTISQSPVRAALTEILGTSPGAVYGEYKFDSPWGAIPGALAGGRLFNAAASVVKGVTNVIPNTAIALTEKATGREATQLRQVFGERKPYIDTAKDPIWNQNSDPERAAEFARHQKQGVELRIENATMEAINKIKAPANADPRFYQNAVYKGLDKVEEMSNRIKNDAWRQVDVTKPVNLRQDILPALDDFKTSVANNAHGRGAPIGKDEGLIDTLVAKIEDMGLVKQGKDDKGRFTSAANTKGNVPLEKLIDVQSQIFAARKAEEGAFMAGRIPNNQLIANLNKISSIIWDGVGKAYPQDRMLQFARDYSVKHHDMLSRGVIADVMAKNKLGETAVHPDLTVDAFLKQYNGLDDLFSATKRLASQAPVPGQKLTGANAGPGGRWLATTNEERAAIKQLHNDTMDAVRSEYHKFAEQAFASDPKAPEKIAKYLRTIEPQLPRIAMVKNELQPALAKLDGLVNEHKLIRNSELARFTGQKADAAIMQIMNSANPAERAGQLMLHLKASPEAMSAFRDGIINQIYVAGGLGAPGDMYRYVKSDRIQNLLKVTMDPGRAERLNKMIEITAKIESGDIATAKRYWLPKTTLLARMFAAGAAKFIGVNTIQGTGIAASAAKQMVIRAWGSRDPAQLFVNAIRDPVWEKVVLGKEPTSAEGAAHLAKQVSKLVGRMEAGRHLFGAQSQENEK